MLLTPHRHLSEVMLREIGHIPGPELEFADDREAYSLSAGIALGMITLGVSPSHQYILNIIPTHCSDVETRGNSACLCRKQKLVPILES